MNPRALWNNMLQPLGQKTTGWSREPPLLCPTPASPYLATRLDIYRQFLEIVYPYSCYSAQTSLIDAWSLSTSSFKVFGTTLTRLDIYCYSLWKQFIHTYSCYSAEKDTLMLGLQISKHFLRIFFYFRRNSLSMDMESMMEDYGSYMETVRKFNIPCYMQGCKQKTESYYYCQPSLYHHVITR